MSKLTGLRIALDEFVGGSFDQIWQRLRGGLVQPRDGAQGVAAVDEGDVGFALMGPVSWDVAGGHAILLAAGGDLYGVSGTPLRYDRRGEFPGQSLLLGGPGGWWSIFGRRTGPV